MNMYAQIVVTETFICQAMIQTLTDTRHKCQCILSAYNYNIRKRTSSQSSAPPNPLTKVQQMWIMPANLPKAYISQESTRNMSF